MMNRTLVLYPIETGSLSSAYHMGKRENAPLSSPRLKYDLAFRQGAMVEWVIHCPFHRGEQVDCGKHFYKEE